MLRAVALSPRDLAISLGLSTLTFWAVELRKLVRRLRDCGRAAA